MNRFFAVTLGFFAFLFSSCVNMKYCNFVEIDAPVEKVFAILESYESYPSFIPEFHKSVQIISEEKRGKGVEPTYVVKLRMSSSYCPLNCSCIKKSVGTVSIF